ncbi:MAG: hypothetical protein AAGE83_12615 [Pseudomonadota bacterium]
MKKDIGAAAPAAFATAAGGAADGVAGGARRKVLEVDLDQFQHRLDSAGMTEARRSEYLQLVWSIVLQFVDLGYQLHPVQQSCGQLGQTEPGGVPSVLDAVECPEPSDRRPTPNAAPERMAERETS